MELPPVSIRLLRKAQSDPSIMNGPLFPECPKCRKAVRPRDTDGVQADAHICCNCMDAGRYRFFGEVVPCQNCTARSMDVVGVMRRRGFPEEALGADISNIASRTKNGTAALQLWASLWPNCEANVALVGAVGSGKTYTAVALCKALLATRGAMPMFSSTTGLLQRLRDSYDRDMAARKEGEPVMSERVIMDAMKTVPVLALDDLGREQPTEWASARLFDIINTRWAGKLTTIVTANPEFWRALPKAWQSRLGSGLRIDFDSMPDRRTAAQGRMM
jgi:DNA replication protein DnaC